MFNNKTAWFSKSCLVDSTSIWVQNGGTIVNMDLAQFLFSDDWTYEDTKDILNSDAYLKEHLAVFRAQYVLDAVNNGSKKCILGTYLLIPPDILEKLEEREPLSNVDVVTKYASEKEVQRHHNKRTHNGKKISSLTNDEPKQIISRKTPPLTGDTNTKGGLISSTPRIHERSKVKNALSSDVIKDLETIPDVKTLPKITDDLEFIDIDINVD